MLFIPDFEVELVHRDEAVHVSRTANEIEQKPLKLTVKHCRAAYVFLCTVSPFSGWRMPDEYRVDFKVNNATMTCGMYEPDPDTITISRRSNTSYIELLMTMSHEMLHLHCERAGKGGHEDHNEHFLAGASLICAVFDWSPEEF